MVGAFFLLFRIRNKDLGCILPVSCLLLATMAANSRFIVRPELASYLFLSLYLYILHQYRSRKDRGIYLLIPLHVLWVNMHGFWVLGLFLVWAFLAGELILWRLRLPFQWKEEGALEGKDYYRLLTVGLAMAAATFITPDPYKMLQLPFDMFGGLKGATGRGGPLIVNELISPFSADTLFSWQAIFYYKVLVAVSAASFLLNFRRINIIHLLIYAGFLYISVQARRNICAFALMAAPITFWNLGSFYRNYIERFVGPSSPEPSPPGGRGQGEGVKRKFLYYQVSQKLQRFTRKRAQLMTIVRAVLSVGLALVMVLFIYDAASDRYYIRDRSNARFGLGVSNISYPKKAIDFIRENNITGNIFNNPAIGHYFTWRCFPERMVFLDGRFNLPDRFLSHYYVPELWPKISEKYQINYILLGHGRSPNITPLTRMLYFNKDWVLIYYDEMAVAFVKNVGENREIIEKFQVRFDATQNEDAAGIPPKNLFGVTDLPVAQFQLANLYATLGLNKRAIKKYEECADISPNFWEARSNLGDMYRKDGRVEDALRQYRMAVETKPNFVAGYVRLGDVYAAMGMLSQAVQAYKKALKRKPKLAAAYYGLGLAYMQTKKYKEAAQHFETMLRLNPNDAMARQMLTYCHRMNPEKKPDQ